MENVLMGLKTILLGVGGALAYFWLSNFFLDRVFQPKGPRAGWNVNVANRIRPWLFMFPALFILGVYLIWPAISSFMLSLKDSSGDKFVGLENYHWMITDHEFWIAVRNNALWIFVVPGIVTFLGLLAATLTDRLSWGNIAKSFIFMPMAISFIGASVIWKFVYEYRATDQDQIGILNAIVKFFGGETQTWLANMPWNNFLLMMVLIWTQTGFAMVILSAALRGIPEETIEAAVIDGAKPFQIFYKIRVPQIWPTIIVVFTTNAIAVLKVFDVVLAMTGGFRETEVLANYMYTWMTTNNDWGKASAIAMVIMFLVFPVMYVNIRDAMKER